MKEIILMLDNVRSALNVGAILRTSDGAGVKKVYLAGITPYPPHPRVLKTALGAEESVDFEHIKDAKAVIQKYKDEGFQIVSIEETEGAQDFFGHNFTSKVLILMGNEITGVQEEIMKMSDSILVLPMKGKKTSLNVATTTGIVLYTLQFCK